MHQKHDVVVSAEILFVKDTYLLATVDNPELAGMLDDTAAIPDAHQIVHDIRSRNDIVQLLKAFYKKVYLDEALRPFFTEVVNVDVASHVELLADFWESVLFGKEGYQGNPMRIHEALHERRALESQHFERWIALFCQTIDEAWFGLNSNRLKTRARGIATLMRTKLAHHNSAPGGVLSTPRPP